MSETTICDYSKLLKGRKVVTEFPLRSIFGEVKRAARELLDESEFNKIYQLGPVMKDKPLQGLRSHIHEMAKKDNINVECRTSIQDGGGYLFFRKNK